MAIIIAVCFSGCGKSEQTSDSTGGTSIDTAPAESSDDTGVTAADSISEEMNLKFECIDGVSFSLSDLQGHPVMIDVWSTHCGPCIERFGFMKQLYRKYEPDGFKIVSVAIDQSEPDSLRRLVDRYQLPFLVVAGARQFWLSPDLAGALPVTYMFDRDGRLRSRVVGLHSENTYNEQISGVVGTN